MNSTQHMQTYFRDYIPCSTHQREPITNFCTQKVCLKFMCPQCIQSHSRNYANHNIESIKTCIRHSSERLLNMTSKLQEEMSRSVNVNSYEEYENKMLQQLHFVRKNLLDQINSYFIEKQKEVKQEMNKYKNVGKDFDTLRKQLQQAINEMKLLNKSLFISSECVQAIKKANSLDYDSMKKHFQNKIYALEAQMNLNTKIETDPVKHNELRAVLNKLVNLKTKKSQRAQTEYKRSQAEYKQQKSLIPISKPPSQQFSYQISGKNYFQSEPLLHFFQCSEPKLHILKIQSIRQGEEVEWHTIELSKDLQIPPFHRSVVTENGNIFLIGGSILQKNSDRVEKSRGIYHCDPVKKKLVRIRQLIEGRSSHSLVCLNRIIYIVGGLNAEEEDLVSCESFNSQTGEVISLPPCNHAIRNSCVAALSTHSLVKIGGYFAEGENSDKIEIYNIANKIWQNVDPGFEKNAIQGQFGLMSCSGWAAINESEIFIFGGYNEEADNVNSKNSFVLEQLNNGTFVIKNINRKNPPTAGGFWNPQAIKHNNKIYSLQNVDSERTDRLDQASRTVLVFDGKKWFSAF